MKLNFTETTHSNSYKPAFQSNRNQEHIENLKSEIEFDYNEFITSLYELAEKNNLSNSEVDRQLLYAKTHRNTELGKLDILG